MKRIKINYFIIGIIATLLGAALWLNVPWVGEKNIHLQQILNRGELRVGSVSSPLTFYMTKEGPTGFDYELAKRFADYLGVKLNVSTYRNQTELFSALASDKIDLIASALMYNESREEQFRAGPSYYSVSQQLIYRQGTVKPKSLQSLQGDIVVTSGSAYVTTLKNLQKNQYPSLTWQATNTLTSKELLLQIVEGKLRYTVADSVSVETLQRIHPQLAVAFDITEEQPVVWYLKRTDDDNLYASLLDFFSNMVEEGTLARLEDKYLGHVSGFDYVDTRTFLSAIDNTLPDLKPLFKKYSKHFSWQLLAAMAYQESHWNPQATSPTGVRGLMMLTRSTAESLGVTNRLDPEQSIRGGAKYLKTLMDRLPSSIPADEKIWFALAAYNIGYGHMMDTRELTKKQGGNPDSWVEVKQRLPLLTKEIYHSQTKYGYARGHEAYNFVENIRKYLASLNGYLQEKEKKDKAEKGNGVIAIYNYPIIAPQTLAQ